MTEKLPPCETAIKLDKLYVFVMYVPCEDVSAGMDVDAGEARLQVEAAHALREAWVPEPQVTGIAG